MYDRPKISSLTDHANEWARFTRDSRIPYGTFADERAGHYAVAIVCALAVVLFALGVIA